MRSMLRWTARGTAPRSSRRLRGDDRGPHGAPHRGRRSHSPAERKGHRHPALILSALGEVDDRVRGLRAGGDDYLVRPFASQEMVARVDALARRSGTVVKETILRVGDLEIDLLARIVRRRGQKIELLPREFKLLEYFARNVGQVVSRAMLLQHVWDLHYDPTTNVIDVYVGRVRRKIDSGQAYPLIHTIRGVGFCLRAPE